MLGEPQGLYGGAVKAGAGAQPGTGDVGAVTHAAQPGGQELKPKDKRCCCTVGSLLGLMAPFLHGSWLRLAPRPLKRAVVALGKLSLLPSIQHRAAEHHRREQMGVGNY